MDGLYVALVNNCSGGLDGRTFGLPMRVGGGGACWRAVNVEVLGRNREWKVNGWSRLCSF